jgi:hypothetical protein
VRKDLAQIRLAFADVPRRVSVRALCEFAFPHEPKTFEAGCDPVLIGTAYFCSIQKKFFGSFG